MDTPWGFLAGGAGFLIGLGGAVLTGWLSQWVGLGRPMADAPPEVAEPRACEDCPATTTKACSRCGHPYCPAHLKWKLAWRSGTPPDGGFGLGPTEVCRHCVPLRVSILLSCLWVFAGFVAMCAGVSSLPVQ